MPKVHWEKGVNLFKKNKIILIEFKGKFGTRNMFSNPLSRTSSHSIRPLFSPCVPLNLSNGNRKPNPAWGTHHQILGDTFDGQGQVETWSPSIRSSLLRTGASSMAKFCLLSSTVALNFNLLCFWAACVWLRYMVCIYKDLVFASISQLLLDTSCTAPANCSASMGFN